MAVRHPGNRVVCFTKRAHRLLERESFPNVGVMVPLSQCILVRERERGGGGGISGTCPLPCLLDTAVGPAVPGIP